MGCGCTLFLLQTTSVRTVARGWVEIKMQSFARWFAAENGRNSAAQADL
jgi:hypothetical protein